MCNVLCYCAEEFEMWSLLWVQVGVDAASAAETTYKNLLSKLPNGSDALIAAYEAIEKTVHEVDDYVRVGYMWFALLFLNLSFLFLLCMELMMSDVQMRLL